MTPSPQDILDAVREQKTWVAELFDELRAGSIDGDGVTRDTFGPGEQFGYGVVEGRAEAMGLAIEHDHGANMYMTLAGRDRTRPKIMMGSHIDSVPRGGNFDGAAGVIGGLVAQRALQSLGITPACDVTTMAIRAEESVWFQVSYIGSRTAFGVLPDGALEATRVDTGRPLSQHMAECGADIEQVRAGKAWLNAKDIRAFVEIHIEQAPQLIEAGLPLAIGTGVPGNFRYPYIRIKGEYAHVGLPRRFRKDAALAASDFALGLDTLWQENDAAGRPMAFTIGRFHTNTDVHALTIVPGEMTLSLDVRAYDAPHLAELEQALFELVRSIEAARGVTFDLGARASADVAPSDPGVFAGLTAAAERLSIPSQPLASPASHDTATFTVAGVPSAMLFVRNENGSHNPYEAMEIDDFIEAAAVMTGWLVEQVTADFGNLMLESAPADDVRHLKVGMSISDRMLPLLTGQITSTEFTLDFECGTPNALFWQALHEGAFDMTEMSLAAHAILTSRDENPFVGLPVFTSRMFRHGSIFVAAASNITTPEDLAGRRIGIPEYQMTAAVWMRGILQEHHGVAPAEIQWITGGVNKPGRRERIALRLPQDIRVDPIDADATLNDMLLAGEIDAIIAPQVPVAFGQGDQRIRQLFANSREVEEAYFTETKIFPIMHLAVLRRELVAAKPQFPITLFRLCDAARRHAMDALHDTDAPYVMLPWQADEATRTRTLMGDDYWPYGIDANQHVLSTFIRYLGEQGLLARPIRVDELFAPGIYQSA